MSIYVTPIPRLIDLAAPAFTLGTANAAGSAETAVASDSTLLVFDTTVPDAITFGQSGAAGSATVAARRDHAHAMEAESPSIVVSNIVTFTRTASAGSGAQAITGAGFQPTAIIVLALNNGNEEVSWGLGDDDNNEADIFSTTSANYSRGDVNIIQLSNASGNDMVAVLTSLDADGFTVTWTKSGSGLDASVKVLCLR